MAQLPSAKSSIEEIDAYRNRIAELRDDLDATEAAPVDLATVKTRVNKFVERQISVANERCTGSELARRETPLGGEGDLYFGQAFSHAPFGILARFLGRDAVEKKLVEMVAPRASGGLPEAERVARIASLKTEIAKIEVAEEAAIRSLEGRGEFIWRRADVRPDVALAADLTKVDLINVLL